MDFKKNDKFINIISNKIIFKVKELREFLINEFKKSLENNTTSSSYNKSKNNFDFKILIKNSETNFEIILKAVQFLWETGFYKDLFNDNFIANTNDYYRKYSYEFLKILKIDDYIIFVENIFDYENYLIPNFLNDFSLKKIHSELENILINIPKEEIMEKFFSFSNPNINNNNNKILNCGEFFLKENQIIYIRKLYVLFRKIKIEDNLKTHWVNYIYNSSSKIYEQHSSNFLEFFKNIFELKKNIDQTVKDAFNNDDKMKLAGRDGFVRSINLKPNFIADYFSRYINYILTEKTLRKNYIIEKIDEFMQIFRNIENKDMFEGFYIKRLSLRLLYGLTNEKEGENYLLEKFKTECGSVFTTKAEEMIKDIEDSIELTKNFHGENKQNLRYNFYVLSSNSWPLNTKIHEGFISKKVCDLQKEYTDYYNSKNSRKVLKWHLPFCTADIYFRKLNVTLEVNGVQCAILNLFNNKENFSQKNSNNDSITFKRILDATFLDKDIIVNSLKNLVNCCHVLKMEKNNGIESYYINEGISFNKSRICINDLSNKEEVKVILNIFLIISIFGFINTLINLLKYIIYIYIIFKG